MSSDKKEQAVVVDAALASGLAENADMTAEDLRLFKLEAELNKDLDGKLLENVEKLPFALAFIIPNEFAERFCYYGFKPLIKSFCKAFMGFTGEQAADTVYTFSLMCYAFPLAGAAISDSFLGKYWTIVSLSGVYVAGLVMCALAATPGIAGQPPNIPSTLPILGMVLIAMGTGGIKPCVSSHGGDQFLSVQKYGLNKFYNYFYMAINAGACLTGFIVLPIKKLNCFGTESDCFAYAWGVCAGMMAFAWIIFIVGHRWYRIVPPVGKFMPWELIKVAVSYLYYASTQGGFAGAKAKANEVYGDGMVLEMLDLGKVIFQILPAPFFWMAFDQNYTSWEDQGAQMRGELTGWFGFSGDWFDSTQASNIINPFFVVALAPILANYLYPMMDKQFNGKFGLVQRMIAGMIFAAISFVVCAWFQGSLDKNCVLNVKTKVCMDKNMSVFWQLVPYAFITLGECLFSISGLNFTYTEVGKRTKASAAALWLCTSAAGSFLDKLINPWWFIETEGAKVKYFYVVAAMCVGAAIVQYVFSFTYVYKADRHDEAN